MKLVIAEKPSVAKSIAEVLGATVSKNGYMEGNGYVISWCIGHLIELAQPESYGEKWKKWTYESLPIMPEEWNYVIKEDTKKQYDVLAALLQDRKTDEVVCATDAGREGELIFRLVYNMAGCNKPIKRLWISSMEESAIKAGFDNLQPGNKYDSLYQSALCRQSADWLVGINGTRLFTVLYGGKVLKVGRVQTPTLAMIAEREEKIANFVKEKYFIVHIFSGNIDAVSERIEKEEEAAKISVKCDGENAIVESVTKEEKKISPPKLYDLTSLQRDANRLFGFTAKKTLEFTQSLYEKKLVTYPRTDSRYLSDDMEETADKVIHAIFDTMPFVPSVLFNPAVKCILNSKKVTDHHAIIPTVEIKTADLSKLPEEERKILYLIAQRLLCATSERYCYESVKAEFRCDEYIFVAKGKTVLKSGWKDFEYAFRQYYRLKEEEKEILQLPELKEGMVFYNVHSKVTEHYTAPPKHYTEETLLSAMERAGSQEMSDEVERKGLGTPATRADIIEKLVRDGFVRREKKNLLITEDGVHLIDILPDNVKSPQLTAEWENSLALVAKGDKESTEFMSDIRQMVSELVWNHNTVSSEQKDMFSRKPESLGQCPNCKKDVLKGKYGVYCSGKCGMNVSKILGVSLTDTQVKTILSGKKVLLNGLISKKTGNKYSAYIIPDGIEEYRYIKDGQEKSGLQYKFKMEFPKKK